MITDAEVIRESLTRPALFAELYDRHHAVIHRFVARRVDRDVAEDLASETFLVAFELRKRFDPSHDDALPWLYGIVMNLLHRHRRREARAWKAVQVSGGVEPWSEIEDGPLEAELTVKRMASVIRRMPERDRDVLLLYAWGDLGYEGIARALDVPVGTVRSRLNRARRTLRAAAGRAALTERIAGRTTGRRRHRLLWASGGTVAAAGLVAVLVLTDVVGLGGWRGGAQPAAAAVLHSAALET